MLKQNLDLRWVQHDADAMAHCLWWQIGGELGADDTRVTVRAVNESHYYRILKMHTYRVILPQTAVVRLASPPGVRDLFNFL